MAFTFEKTNFEGLWIIKPHMFPDKRGIYKKSFEKNIFADHGITANFTEGSNLYTQKGALRGLHYQTQKPQAKLVQVITGKLYDVAVDLREDSLTFGEVFSLLLDAKNHISVYIPEGFAHGFIALEKDTVFSYHCTNEYIPQACGGIRWNDPGLHINWPLEEYGISDVILTDKDKNWPTLQEYIEMRETR